MRRANLYRRGTLLIPSGPVNDPDRPHLHIICTDPDDNGDQVVVSVCSKRNPTDDPTCILQKYEHRWLRREYFVDYRFSKKWAGEKLERGVEANLFQPDADLNLQTFLRVLRGILASPNTPPLLKAYYRSIGSNMSIAA